jgi:hypothetical protein
MEFVLYFAATCFCPCWPSSGGIHNYFRKLLHPQRICYFVLLCPIYCICLANTAAIYLICVCELSKLRQITSLLNVRTLKCVDIDVKDIKCSSILPGLPGAICQYFYVLLFCNLFSLSFPIPVLSDEYAVVRKLFCCPNTECALRINLFHHYLQETNYIYCVQNLKL